MNIRMLSICALVLICACSKDGNDDDKDPSGKCLVKTASVTGADIQPYRSEYEYNSAGQLIKDKYYANNVLTWYDTYQYDSKGNATVWERYNSEDHIHYRRVAGQYDSEGRITAYTEYLFELFNLDTTYYVFVYQPDKIIGYDQFTKNIADTTNRTIRYYENGNLVKTDTYSGLTNTITGTTTYTYSANQNKRYDVEKALMIYNHTPADKNMVASSLLTVAGDFSLATTYTYVTNASGYITQTMTNQKRTPISPVYPSFDLMTETKYGYTCN